MHVDFVRQALRSQPFRPFTIRLVDGRLLEVAHPDFVAVSRRFVFYVHPDSEQVSWIEPGLIVSLDLQDGAPTHPHRQQEITHERLSLA